MEAPARPRNPGKERHSPAEGAEAQGKWGVGGGAVELGRVGRIAEQYVLEFWWVHGEFGLRVGPHPFAGHQRVDILTVTNDNLKSLAQRGYLKLGNWMPLPGSKKPSQDTDRLKRERDRTERVLCRRQEAG